MQNSPQVALQYLHVQRRVKVHQTMSKPWTSIASARAFVHGVLASTVTDAYGFSLVCKVNFIGQKEIVEMLVTDTMEKLYLLQQKTSTRV
jgi:hypothetical protein